MADGVDQCAVAVFHVVVLDVLAVSVKKSKQPSGDTSVSPDWFLSALLIVTKKHLIDKLEHVGLGVSQQFVGIDFFRDTGFNILVFKYVDTILAIPALFFAKAV